MKVLRSFNREKTISTNDIGKNGYLSTKQKKKLDAYLTSYTRMDSK
jgi:hypothetical protein